MGNGYSNGNALCPSQLEHALDIFPKKGGFYGHFIGLVLLYQFLNGVVDLPQSVKHLFDGLKFYDIHLQHLDGVSRYTEYGVSHDHRTGINA